MSKIVGLCAYLLFCLSACAPSTRLHKQIDRAEAEFQDHVGFMLYDPDKKQSLYAHQADRYFIPASNTKILTLYTALCVLGDSLPALRYVQRGDSLIVWGTGDPSFLYDDVMPDGRTYQFLSRSQKVFYSPVNFDDEPFAPGWAWSDYRYAYQVERTAFPIYGNRFHMRKVGTRFEPSPRIFAPEVERASQSRERNELVRRMESNNFIYVPGKRDSSFHWEIPFHYSDPLLIRLLSDTLKKEVSLLRVPPPPDARTLYSIPADSAYKVMMQESDNFIAEQVLVMCAGVLSDTLRADIAIREANKRFLADLPDKPVWVDGCGLSRMNLLTPRSIIRVWEKALERASRERLQNLLAVGGVNGTLRNSYRNEKPYVFAKTGTLRNNHMLSGFLVTRRGRTLLFSWMNNNFTASTSAVRGRMEEILKFIYETY